MPRSESPKPPSAGAILARTSLALLSWALVSSTTACAGSAKDLALVRDELAKVQRDHDALAKRVFELEAREAMHRAEEAKAAAPIADANATTGASPAGTASEPDGPSSGKPLKVVKLAPPTVMAAEPFSSATVEDDDDGPRPTLEIGPSGIKQTEPDASSAKGKASITSKNPVLDPAAVKDYEAAFALVKAKKHAQALDAFAGFLVRYPDHPYAANALFWRGECYYAEADYTASIQQYEALLARFPASQKSADGLLKLGLAHKKLGAQAKAREAFARLRKEFPTSEAAKKIPPEDAS